MTLRRCSLFLLLALCVLTGNALGADNWAGRRLAEVLDELRAAGLPLLYSDQVVSDALLIEKNPPGTLQLERLRAVLRDVGLELQPLQPTSEGYAVVRARPGLAATTAAAAPGTNPALDEVTVHASRYNLSREEPGVNAVDLPRATLEKLAGTSEDVLRSVQYLPGAGGNNISALTQVRGGYADENLVRFDGVELYNPAHLKDFQGLFGLLDPQWVQSMQFYSGAFPVQFGNHLSAVLDIAPRTNGEPTYSLSASLLYTQLFGSGSYADATAHWLAGYRRSNLAMVAQRTENRVGEPQFEDLLLRHSYRLGEGELRIGLLRLHDDLQLQSDTRDEVASSDQEDTYLWLGWRQPLSMALDYQLQLSHAMLNDSRIASIERATLSSGTLNDQRAADLTTLAAQLQLQQSVATRWQAGVQVNHGRADYHYRRAATYATPLRLTFNKPASESLDFAQRFSRTDYAAHLSISQQRGAWRGELGMRYEAFAALPHGSQWSPRLNLQYSLTPASTLHLSSGRYVQAQALNALDVSVSQPRFSAPQRLQQHILGWTHSWPSQLQLRIEAYDKRGERLAAHSENLLSFITFATDLEIDRNVISASRSRAQGLEISVTAPPRARLGWWANYSAARAQDYLDDQWLRRSWDQPQAITLGASWTQSRWLFTGSASWHTGWAYTPLLLNAERSSAVLGKRNSARFKDFLSLELRVQYTRPLYAAQLQWFFELRNALNRDNDCCREVTVTQDSGGAHITLDNQAGLPLIPLLGFSLKF